MEHSIYFAWRGVYIFLLIILIVPRSLSMVSLDNDPKGNNNAANCNIRQGDVIFFQYNELQASMVNKLHITPLQITTSRVSVLCNTPASIFLRFNGKETFFSSTSEQTYYSLGRINSNGNLGYFSISVSNPIIDGERGMVLRTSNKKNIDKIAKNLPVNSNYYYTVSRDGKTIRSTNMSFDISVHPYLNNISDTNGPLIDGAQLDGNVELVISYGD